jgi:adenosylcobinamide-phosphate synthase
MTGALLSRAVAASLASIADRLIPEPPDAWHPVAWFGTGMTRLEQRIWRDDRAAGAVYTAAGLSVGVLAGVVVRSTTVALTVAVAARQLGTVGGDIGTQLERGDLEGARGALPSLVGRDPSELDESGVAAAVVESLAENSVDAVIAPLFWGFVAGAPGALGYRAINTMDAMVGHRSERFENFGWASARLDDVANWVPARLFAAAVQATNPSATASVRRAVREDAGAHPSPNAGVAEAAVAGALGVELGGTLRYGERVEHRPLLGRGPRPDGSTIAHARSVCDRAQVAVLAAAAVVGWATGKATR